MLKLKGKVKTRSPWAMIRTGKVVITIMAGFLYLYLTGGAAAAAPFSPSFSPEVGLIPYDQQAKQQDSPAQGVDSSGNLYALWVDNRNGHPDIYFAYRPSGGDWGPNVKVNDDTGKASQSNPALAVDDLGNAFAVWNDQRNDQGDIYFAYRPAGGTWGTNLLVSDDTKKQWQGNPAVATDGNGKAYVIWEDSRTGSRNLYFSTVSKTQSAWTAETNSQVNDSAAVLPGNPSLGTFFAFDQRWVVVVWQDYRNNHWDIYSSALNTSPGGTWQGNSRVNDDFGGVTAQEKPKIAVRGIYVMALWQDRRNGHWDIYSSILFGSWLTNEIVNSDSGNADQTNPSIAVDGTNAYAVWKDRRSGRDKIYYAYRPLAGGWTNSLVETSMNAPNNPVISVDALGGQPYLLYEENFDIRFTRKPATWLISSVKVNDDAGTVVQEDPALAVDKTGNATALWGDTRNGLRSIYSAHRPSGGNWGGLAPVNDLMPFFSPSIALDRNNNAYAIWSGEMLIFSYLPAGGAWGDIVQVSSGIDLVVNPDIGVDSDGNAYAVWRSFNQVWSDIYFAYRPAGGAWGTNVKVNDGTSAVSKGSPAIAVDGSGNAMAIWEGSWNGGQHIYTSYRPAGGSWGANVKVNDNDGLAWTFSPAIAMDRLGNGYALWAYSPPGGFVADIYFAYRPVGGAWGSPVMVPAGSSWKIEPDIAVDDQGNAFAVWAEDNKISFAYRPAGQTWSSPFRVSTDEISSKADLSIALDGKRNIYILWEDDRYGWATPAVFFSYAAGPPWEIYLPLVIK